MKPMTVRLTEQELVIHCLIKESDIIKMYKDNMVVFYSVLAMVSRSPLLMMELRKLYNVLKSRGIELQMHHLPSALNLYANHLSRKRRKGTTAFCRDSQRFRSNGGAGIRTTTFKQIGSK